MLRCNSVNCKLNQTYDLQKAITRLLIIELVPRRLSPLALFFYLFLLRGGGGGREGGVSFLRTVRIWKAIGDNCVCCVIAGTFQKSKVFCFHSGLVAGWCLSYINQLAQQREEDPSGASTAGAQGRLRTMPPSFVPEDLVRRGTSVEVIFCTQRNLFRNNHTEGYW